MTCDNTAALERDKAPLAPSGDRVEQGNLLTLYLLSLISGISLGLFNPLASTYLKESGVADLLIGANSTLFFLMVALGASVVTRLQHYGLGLRQIIILGLALTGVSALIFPLGNDLPYWFVIRGMMGIGVSLYMVGGTTLLNQHAPAHRRAAVNGIYCLAFAVGFGMGPLAGTQLYTLSPTLAFTFGSSVVLVGAILVRMGLPELAASRSEDAKISVWRKISRPLAAIFAYGFAEATLVSIYPLFLLESGSTIPQQGYVFGIFVLGSLIFTLPITTGGDRWGRQRVLGGSILCGAVALTGLISQSGLTSTMLGAAFVAGAALGAIYPLAMSLVGEALSAEALPSGMSLFTSCFGAGCVAGPLTSALVVQHVGMEYLFVPTLALLLGAMAFSLINRK